MKLKKIIVTIGLGILVASSFWHTETLGMGAAKGDFWEKVEGRKPAIREAANTILRQIGYDPTTLTSHVFFAGQGEELWSVAYWRTPRMILS